MSTNEDLTSLLGILDWEDLVISNVAFSGVTQVCDGSTYAPGALPSISVSLESPGGEISGVVIKFTRCQEFGIWFEGGFNPRFEIASGHVKWWFYDGIDTVIICESVTWKALVGSRSLPKLI